MLPAEARRTPGAPVVAARALVLCAALALAFAGCGDEDDESAPADEPNATELTVSLDADGPGGDPAQTETVTCEAGAGSSACARVKPTDFAPLDPATPCTEIYGGADEATLEGTVAGEPVAAALTRVNGCEIDRFERLVPLLRELFPGYKPGASLSSSGD